MKITRKHEGGGAKNSRKYGHVPCERSLNNVRRKSEKMYTVWSDSGPGGSIRTAYIIVYHIIRKLVA